MQRFNTTFFVFILGVFAIISCNKKETKKEDLISDFVASGKEIQKSTSDSIVKLTKIEKISNQEILMEFVTDIENSDTEPLIIQNAMTDLMLQTIKKNPKNMLLINQGINLRLMLLGKDETKLFSETVNKSNLNTLGKNIFADQNARQLNGMLEIVNNQLPKVDSVGVKITKVTLGNHSDLIYTAIVPQDIAPLLQQPEAKNVIKKNMAKDKNYKQTLKEMKIFGISAITYQYRNSNEKLLLEIEMQEKDFKN